MFEHLTNCHGEITTMLALLSMIPLIGQWLKSTMNNKCKEHSKEDLWNK